MKNLDRLFSWIKALWLSAHPTRDSRRKSLLKAISRRILGTCDTIILSWILTGTFTIAISIGGLEIITKTILYYFHERSRARIEADSHTGDKNFH